MYSKEYLLSLDYFVQNEYFELYYNLILNTGVARTKFKTNSHHIIPRHYFKANKKTIDNSIDNIVELSFKDHLLAHLYLSGCTTGQNRYWNLYAIFYMSGHTLSAENMIELNTIKNLDIYQTLYEEAIAAAPNHRKGCKVSEQTRQKMCIAAKLKSSPTKGRKWVNDGARDFMVPAIDVQKYIEVGYKLGRLYKHSEEWKAAQAERNHNRVITDEFRQKMSTIVKNTAFANPALITAERKQRNSEWHKNHSKGKLNSMYGKHLSAEAKNKISKKKSGKVAVYKDQRTTYITTDELQHYLNSGWKRGRAKKPV